MKRVTIFFFREKCIPKHIYHVYKKSDEIRMRDICIYGVKKRCLPK